MRSSVHQIHHAQKMVDKVHQLLLSLVNNATAATQITNATVATARATATTFACHVCGIVIKMVRAFALALGLQFGSRLGDRSCL